MLKTKTIWVLQGARVGDNAQARELASQLDGESIFKHLAFNALHHLPNLVLGASVTSLAEDSKRTLRGPWPDMVIGMGKRTTPISRWIKEQSGGATKIVHLGRPRAPLSAFDLVIATPQYGLPHQANVIERRLPFATPQKVGAAELTKWQMEWDDLPRPLIAVAVGNAKYPLRFGQYDIVRFASELNKLARALNGTILLMASPRTPRSLVKEISVTLQFPNKSYDLFDKANNPYQASLALADQFVVTSDSISMISEMINTGKPVSVFELPLSKFRLRWSAKLGFGAWLARNGILQPPRDVPGMVRQLIEDGIVGSLGKKPEMRPMLREVDVIVSRLNALLNS
jgi:uncharacterized protein